jgi:hypothetical protein
LGDGSGHFPAKTNFDGSYANYPGGLAVGDFNGDGKLDFATTGGSRVTVAFGRGDGSFNSASNYYVFSSPRNSGYIRAADLRGSGRLDLVVAITYYSGTTNSFCVMQNKGDGTFSAPVFYVATNLSDQHYGLNVLDLNADGKPDVVVLNYNTQSVTIWLNKGDGTFLMATNISVPSVSPSSIAAADFNGDGNMDLIARGGSAARILTGNGDGSFTVGSLMNVTDGGGATSSDTVAAGDFSGRGMSDLALVNSPATSAAIMLNQTPPILTLTPMAGYNQVTWLKTFGAGYSLEYATNLTDNWKPYPSPPVILGNQKAVADWSDTGQKFYRLKK